MYNLAIRKCTSPHLLAPRLKIYYPAGDRTADLLKKWFITGSNQHALQCRSSKVFVFKFCLSKCFWIHNFLFFHLVCTQIHHKVFRRVSRPHTPVHVQSMDFPNLVHTLVAISRGSHVDSDFPLVSKVKCEKFHQRWNTGQHWVLQLVQWKGMVM